MDGRRRNAWFGANLASYYHQILNDEQYFQPITIRYNHVIEFQSSDFQKAHVGFE